MENTGPGVEVKNHNSRCWSLLDPTDALIAARLKPFDAQICKQIELFEDNIHVGSQQSHVHRKTVGLRCSNCHGEKSRSLCFVPCAMDMASCIRQLYQTHVHSCGMTLSIEDTKPCEKACYPQLFNPTDTTPESLLSPSFTSLSLEDFCIFRCQELSLFDLMPKIPPALAKNDTSGVLNRSNVGTMGPNPKQEPTPFTEEILSPPQMHNASCEIRNFFSPHILLSPGSLSLHNSPSAVMHIDPNLLLSPPRPSGGLFRHIPVQQAAFPSFLDVAPENFTSKLQHQIHPRSPFLPVSQRSATPHQTTNHPGLYHLAGAGDSIHQREVFTPKSQDDQPRLLPRTRNQTTAFHPFQHQLPKNIDQEDQYCLRKLQSIDDSAVQKYKSSVFNNMLHSIPSHVRDAIALLASSSALGDKYPDGTPVPEGFKLICPDDHQLLSFYQFHVMKQLRHCHFKEEDRNSKGGNRKSMKIGFGGLECVHCAPYHLPRRFFWRACKRLADSFSEISDHVTSCRACPGPIKKALHTLKDYHEEQKKRKEIRHGSRTIFFRRLWKRIHQDDADVADAEDDTTSTTTNIKEPSRNGPKGPSLLRNTIPKERSHANSLRQSVANNSFLSITTPSLRLLPQLQPEANPGHTEPSNAENEEGCIQRTVSTAESETTAETTATSKDSTWRTSVSSPSPNMMVAAPPATAGDFSPFSKNVEEQKRFLCRTPPPFLPSHATPAPPPLPWIVTTPKSTIDSDEKEEDAASCTSTLASSSSSWCSHNLHHHYRTRSVIQKRNTRKKHTMKKPPSESSSSRNPSQLAKRTIGAKKSPRRKPSSSEEAIPRMTTRSFAARGSYMNHDTDAGAAAAMVRPRAGAYKDVSSLSSATSRQTASCGCCRCHCT